LIEQMVMSELLLRGLLVSHIRRMRVLYRARQSQLIEGLRVVFGTDLQLEATDTGTHVILLLKPDADDTALARLAAQAGLIVRPLSPYYATRQTRQGLLFGFAAFNPLEIETGLEKLRAISHALAPLVVRIGRTLDKLG
jgi:GntR family transcriptional regulator/MocR family aminotransferase